MSLSSPLSLPLSPPSSGFAFLLRGLGVAFGLRICFSPRFVGVCGGDLSEAVLVLLVFAGDWYATESNIFGLFVFWPVSLRVRPGPDSIAFLF
jgi:hypothetical protein